MSLLPTQVCKVLPKKHRDGCVKFVEKEADKIYEMIGSMTPNQICAKLGTQAIYLSNAAKIIPIYVSCFV